MGEVKELRHHGDPLLLSLIMVMTQVNLSLCVHVENMYTAVSCFNKPLQARPKRKIHILIKSLPFLKKNSSTFNLLPSTGNGTHIHPIQWTTPPSPPRPLFSSGCAGYVTHLCARGHGHNRINNVCRDSLCANISSLPASFLVYCLLIVYMCVVPHIETWCGLSGWLFLH